MIDGSTFYYPPEYCAMDMPTICIKDQVGMYPWRFLLCWIVFIKKLSHFVNKIGSSKNFIKFPFKRNMYVCIYPLWFWTKWVQTTNKPKFFESFRDLLKEKEKGFAYLKPSHLSFRFQGSSVQDYIFKLSIR